MAAAIVVDTTDGFELIHGVVGRLMLLFGVARYVVLARSMLTSVSKLVCIRKYRVRCRFGWRQMNVVRVCVRARAGRIT